MATPWALAEEWDRAWRGDAEGEAFHGRALLPVLADVGHSEAGFRATGAHSIAEILKHVTAWHAWALERVEGRSPGDVVDDGWVSLPTVDPATWSAILSELHAKRDALLARLRALDDAGRERCRPVLRFILHHDLHHGGQIGLLRAAARARRG